MKKLTSILTMIAIVAMMALSASAKDSKSSEKVTFTVAPQMTCQNCENKIKSNLRFEKGVSEIVTDINSQTVTITYDPAKTDVAKLTKALGKIGYTATEGVKAGCAKKKCCDKKAEKTQCGKKACCGKADKAKGHCGGCAKKTGCAKKDGCTKK